MGVSYYLCCFHIDKHGNKFKEKSMSTDMCEWNPDENREAFKNEHNVEATWIIGNGKYFLCDRCVQLPIFKKYKKKKIKE